MKSPSTVCLLLVIGVWPVAAQQGAPFAVGERLIYAGTYHLLFNIHADSAGTLAVEAIDTVAGVPEWRFSFHTDVSVPLYHDHSVLTSWTGVGDFVSRRFVHNIDETGFSRHDDYHIMPDSGIYRNMRDQGSARTPAHPLDDLAFFYYLRLPATTYVVGNVITLTSYFRDAVNPVTITVQRHEACTLPDGTTLRCVVLKPVVDDPPHGMFMRSKDAELWLTDDARRIPVRIKSGSMTLTLQQMVEPPAAPH